MKNSLNCGSERGLRKGVFGLERGTGLLDYWAEWVGQRSEVLSNNHSGGVSQLISCEQRNSMDHAPILPEEAEVTNFCPFA